MKNILLLLIIPILSACMAQSPISPSSIHVSDTQSDSIKIQDLKKKIARIKQETAALRQKTNKEISLKQTLETEQKKQSQKEWKRLQKVMEALTKENTLAEEEFKKSRTARIALEKGTATDHAFRDRLKDATKKHSKLSIVTSCQDAYLNNLPSVNGKVGNGIYLLDTDGKGKNPPFEAYCNMSHNGGWILVLKADTRKISNMPTSKDLLFTKKDTNHPSHDGLYILKTSNQQFNQWMNIVNGTYTGKYTVPHFKKTTLLNGGPSSNWGPKGAYFGGKLFIDNHAGSFWNGYSLAVGPGAGKFKGWNVRVPSAADFNYCSFSGGGAYGSAIDTGWNCRTQFRKIQPANTIEFIEIYAR